MHQIKYNWKRYFNIDIKRLANGRLHMKQPHTAPEAERNYHCIKGYKNYLQANRSELDLSLIRGVESKNYPQ